MWRAFFFSVGTILIILGVECLVVDRFVVQGARIPAFVAKILDGSSELPGTEQFASDQSRVSPYGPSRFQDPYQSTGNFYGGVPSSGQGSNQNSGFSLAGFGKQTGGPAPLSQSNAAYGRQSNPSSPNLKTHELRPRDWMPWSLLAAGTLVVLYTNTSTRGFPSD